MPCALHALFLALNAAAVAACWWFAARAYYHKRVASGSAAYTREARTDARRYADEAKKTVQGGACEIEPFVPGEEWFNGQDGEQFNY